MSNSNEKLKSMKRLSKSNTKDYDEIKEEMGADTLTDLRKQYSMTEKQFNFCYNYSKWGNGTRSYLAAYSEKEDITDKDKKIASVNASKLLKQDKIKKLIDDFKRDLDNDEIANKQQIQLVLTEIMSDPYASSQSRVAAARELATLQGLRDNKDASAVNITFSEGIKFQTDPRRKKED